MSSRCLNRGAAHMRMVSFLSLNQALSMQPYMWRAWYISVRHCLIQRAQKHSATMFSTLCDALEYFPIKMSSNFQLKFSSF